MLGGDFLCLGTFDSSWLKDNVINGYLELLQAHYDPKKVNVYFFNSFFFNFYASNEPCGYHLVKGFTKRAKVYIFKLKAIIVPINKNGNHWCLGYIKMQKKEIYYIDSLLDKSKDPDYKIQKILLQFLNDEYKAKNNESELPDKDEWTFPLEKGPQQGNAHDCGVFTLCMSECIFAQLPPQHLQSEMLDWRKVIALDLFNGKITRDEKK